MLSGGYVDDRDYGDTIIYTGHGGQDPNTREQNADQILHRGNLALVRCMHEGYPVRVIRGHGLDSSYAPNEGYRYDGLYRVTDYWQDRGIAGFLVWRYRLEKIEGEVIDLPHDAQIRFEEPERIQSTISRIIRDTEQARSIKALYDYRCQICNIRLEGPGGPYVEAAHIKPLGSPHNGPDVPGNIICLCPNHHVLFDIGSFVINDDLSLFGSIEGDLTINQRHTILREYLEYRREHYSI